MPDKKDIIKRTFTVEGETEKWYLDWLENQINNCAAAKKNVSINSKVEQNPVKFVKSKTKFVTPKITHICDVESGEECHVRKFHDIIDQVEKAKKLGKKIEYDLKYSNFTFELWISLHKVDCFGPLTNRTQYLTLINRAFDEKFVRLDHYKREADFKRCLSKLTLDDVRSAIQKAKTIMDRNDGDPGKHKVRYRKFEYYAENPALTIWEAIDEILGQCF